MGRMRSDGDTSPRSGVGRLERVLSRVADGFIPDLLIDAVRSRVGQVGVQEAELAALIQKPRAHSRCERARIAPAAELARGIDGADAGSVRSEASVPHQAHWPADILPQEEATPLTLEAKVNHAFGLDVGRVFGIHIGVELPDPLNQEVP